MTPAVVELGAWCDYVPDDESVASPGSVSFAVHEFARLADGRRVILQAGERGFSLSGPRAHSGHPLGNLTAGEITSSVLTTVLPDEDDGEEHPWGWLTELLRLHGVIVAAGSLRWVPYVVEFSERLQALRTSGQDEVRN